MSVNKIPTNKQKTKFAWKVVIHIPINEFYKNGKQKRKHLYIGCYHTEKEAKQAERDALNKYDNNKLELNKNANAIDTMLRTCISETWIEDEIQQQRILSDHEHAKLITAYNEIKKAYPDNDFTLGKVIANLNFGFWTNLCSKWYCSNIWNKGCCFKGVFVNYPSEVNNIGVIAAKLRLIRRFRNRIFHYEPIFKFPQNTLKIYNQIMEIINYLPSDNSDILKDTSTFLHAYNQAMTIK